jgi:hypothetical protein
MSLTFLAVAPHRSYAEVNDDYALKISLENQLERKLKQVIMEITGTDRVVIFVNTELTSARGDSDKLMDKRERAGASRGPGKERDRFRPIRDAVRRREQQI